MRLHFNKKYFLFFILLFLTEVGIALFVHDWLIRPYGGDVLVVMLIYCFLKSFFNWPVRPTVYGVLLFSFLIEYLQYLNFVQLLGLQNNALANVVLGNSFAWADMLAYMIGAGLLLLLEFKLTRI